ncbi:spore germination lipoprotein GerD [Gracilibacillus sp. S3-1-1]|uniref:Spore germination lipoprotein GerD n=1 Tax=Gracilibacillus pellucidus TaxID=3095368 RepID=A0ACC6M8K6_9BACI|nr:spore germination lipoprotein GerD [Gracilibacillus sp. S3-1-1]MDX8047316.1 spore germination lipoprotein GerD [Gracilibacillus sp. S3-1-1]
MYRFLYICCFSLLFIAGCGGEGGAAANKEQEGYEGTKKMVADILKTDDGKKAITEVLTSEDMKQTYVIESKAMKEAVQEALTSEKGKEFWEKMFNDPKFVESFAMSLQDKQEDVTKNLMSDSTYQEKLMEVLSNPEMEQQTMTLLTSQEFRSHLEKVMEETFQSPMFQAKIADLLLQAAKEMKPSSSGEESNSQQSEDSNKTEPSNQNLEDQSDN